MDYIKVLMLFSFLVYLSFISPPLTACKVNCHKRCELNVANNCGINTKEMADILKEMGVDLTEKPKPGKKKVYCTLHVSYVISLLQSNLNIIPLDSSSFYSHLHTHLYITFNFEQSHNDVFQHSSPTFAPHHSTTLLSERGYYVLTRKKKRRATLLQLRSTPVDQKAAKKNPNCLFF